MKWAKQLFGVGGDVMRAAPDPVTMEEFGYLLGRGSGEGLRTRSGVVMTSNRALGITAWYSGVRFLAEGVAFLPVHNYRQDGFGEESIKSRRANPPWLTQPDVEMPWQGIVEFWMMSLLHKGNAFSFKLRAPSGQVVGLRELHPDRVRVVIAPDNRKRFVVDGNVDNLFDSSSILHIPGLAYNGRVGLNPLAVHSESLGGVAAADEHSHRFYGSGTHMGGVISLPGEHSDAELENQKRQWQRFHEGLRQAHQTGVLANGARYDRVSLNAEESQMLQSRQFGIDEVSRILRIPPHKLYELTRSTNNNIEHQSIEAVTDGIQPWAERIETWVNFDQDLTVPGNYIEFVLEGRLRGDTATRFEAYQRAIGGPWMAVNEGRRRENLPPVPGGDAVLSPLNMGQATQGQAASQMANDQKVA